MTSKITINCVVCGKERLVYKCQNIRTCSKECRYKRHSEMMTGGNNPFLRSDVQEKIKASRFGRHIPKGSDSKLWKSKEVQCATCNKVFFVTTARLAVKRGRYCSKHCRNINKERRNAISIRQKGRKLSNVTKEKIRQSTLKQFIEKGHPNKGKKWKICESKRKNMARPGQWAKETNPSWKGGVSPLRRLIRESNLYHQWRTSVFIRDGRTCVNCGLSNKTIQADHVVPFYKICDEEKISSMDGAKMSMRLWDISNGRTLCIDCHKKTETWGRPKNRCTI